MKQKIKLTDLSWKAFDKIIVSADLKACDFSKKMNVFLKKKKKTNI
jgi:menaquinone-dependent protoporphyrinogen IX oxidase